jgi:two-component sensor histidine kinase
MNFWLGERAQAYFEDVIAARDVRVSAVELRNALQTAESSQRGFIITGNEIYLAPYQSAKYQAQRQLGALQGLLKFDRQSDVTLERLDSILKTKFEEFDRSIDLKRNKNDADVLATFRTNSGKTLTDEANVFFSGLIVKADNRLTSGVSEQRSNTGRLRLISGISALVIVLMVAGAAYAVSHHTRELTGTRREVEKLNSNLEERVASRTADLAHARDRAEILLAEVNHRVANSLALVSTFVSLQSKALDDQSAKDALAETQDRIYAISLVHKKLYSSADVRSVDLVEYLSGLLDHLRTSVRSQAHGINLVYDIEPIELDTNASINLGVVITELVTNAFKYAYPDGTGEIRVRLKKSSDQVELVVEDDGVGRDESVPARGTGVGTRIVSAMCRSLGAQMEYQARHPGTAARLIFVPKEKMTADIIGSHSPVEGR